MAIMDTLLGWILLFHPALSILIVSLLVSLIITYAIKLFTDQTLMKDMREELKELQKQIKELRNNPKKMAKANERFMETNMKYMSHSMRPTLFTFLPIILVFGWLNAHIGYYPINPDQPFRLTAAFEDYARGEVNLVLPDSVELLEGDLKKEILHREIEWVLSGKEGKYDLVMEYNDKTYAKSVIISEERTYAPVEQSFKKKRLFFSSDDENGVNSLKLSNEKILPFIDVPVIKDLPWISGWGWFGAYFLFSIVFSMGLRRILKIY